MPFTSGPWSSPESDLEAGPFCACCLLDLNEPGAEKAKAKCYLPVRSTPGGPINTNAMASAAAYLGKTKVPAAERAKAARKLRRLYGEAKREPPEMVKRYAG